MILELVVFIEKVFLDKEFEVIKVKMFIEDKFEVIIEKRSVEENVEVLKERVFLLNKWERILLVEKIVGIKLFIMGVKLFVFFCDRIGMGLLV